MTRSSIRDRLALATMSAGIAAFIASLFVHGMGEADRFLFRFGIACLVAGSCAFVALKVRRVTAEDLERARQEGFDDGYELGVEARCDVRELELVRVGRALSVAEGRPANQLGK